MIVLVVLVGLTFDARAFDGDRALESVAQQCALGPRVPGQVGHERGRRWIAERIRELGMQVQEQPFRARLALSGVEVDAVNLWGVPNADGPTTPAILLSAHWDTRPWADRDPSRSNPPLDGANDGASGVAMVLELARSLRESDLRDRVAIAFWDAEDGGVNGDDATWALGARHAAANPLPWIDRIVLGINLDMVGGEDLMLVPEIYSQSAAPGVVAEIWALGRRIAPDRFANGPARRVLDDHVPWIEAGLPFVDMIGLPYRYWHTAGDRLENCSAEVMESVGNVMLMYIQDGAWRHRQPTTLEPIR